MTSNRLLWRIKPDNLSYDGIAELNGIYFPDEWLETPLQERIDAGRFHFSKLGKGSSNSYFIAQQGPYRPLLFSRHQSCSDLLNSFDVKFQQYKVDLDGENIFMLRVVEAFECFDYENSVYKRFPDGAVSHIKKLRILREKIPNLVHLFVIDE